MLEYRRIGRSRRNITVFAAVWAVLLGLLILVDAAPWIIAFLGMFTLPLLWEIIRNPVSHLTLDDGALAWHSIVSADRVPLSMIDKVRFDRRLDLSMRVSLLLTDGRKIRLPHDALPPPERLEQALQTRGIHTERHPFSLMG